jgi:hypothetical protein
LVFAVALGLLSAVASAATFPVGFYGGGFGPPASFAYTQIEFEKKGPALLGRIYQPYSRTDVPEARNIRVSGEAVKFDAAGMRFDLHRTNSGLQGSVQTPSGRVIPAYFAIRPGYPPQELGKRYEGTFDLGGGRLLTLSRNNDSGAMWYLELPSGRTGFLYNLSDKVFIAGPCLYCAGPERLRVRFGAEPGAQPFHTVFVRIDGKDLIGRRLASYTEEQVTFTSKDGTELAGSLFLPRRAGTHPAVALVHGSGSQTRNGFYGHIRFLAEAYARRGIAALAYDKRGTGESKGVYDTANLATLADDAASALRYLASRKDIDGSRLGLSGSSQAGWLVALAASRYPDVQILQVRSGSAPMGVEESERRRLVRQMTADRFGAADIARALRIRTLMDDYAKTGANWNALAAAAAPAKDEFWMKHYIGGLPEKDSSDWPWLREAFTYDVTPDYAGYRGRWQILYGAADALIDPKIAVPLARGALAGGRAKEIDIEVLPNATHIDLEGKTGGEKEFPRLQRFVPGYFDKVVGWAAARLGVQP